MLIRHQVSVMGKAARDTPPNLWLIHLHGTPKETPVKLENITRVGLTTGRATK